MAKRKIRLSAVAKRARTSLSTASLVLNGRSQKARIAQSTSERILRAAKDLGYQPANRTPTPPPIRTLGVVFLLTGGRGFHEHFAEFYLDLSCELSRRGCLVCTDRGGDMKDLEEALATGPLRHTDGLIFAALTDVHEDLVRRLDALGKPYVLVNRRSQPNRPCVTTDNEARGYRQAMKLYAAGHERIVFFDTMPGGSSQASTERYLGVLRAARERGLAERLIYVDCSEYLPAIIQQRLQETVRTHPKVTGLVFSSMNLSSHILQLLTAEGLSIPRDLSVVACDTNKRYAGFEPRIDSLVTPTEKMGRDVAAMLLELIENKDDKSSVERTVIVPGEELPAPTFGPPRRI